MTLIEIMFVMILGSALGGIVGSIFGVVSGNVARGLLLGAVGGAFLTFWVTVATVVVAVHRERARAARAQGEQELASKSPPN